MTIKATWEDRDLPVLTAIVNIYERTQFAINFDDISAETGFPVEDVEKSVRALNESGEGYIRCPPTNANGDVGFVLNPLGPARRAAGSWPTPELLADRFIRQLDNAIELASGESKSKLQTLRAFVAEGGRDLVTNVMAAVLTGQFHR